ncbi:MAG: esterase [Actinobacteria bacterium]|nr:esterase [Actinomycetota bacterium]MBI3688028.1 esterase [Actinomycetota bacterium]
MDLLGTPFLVLLVAAAAALLLGVGYLWSRWPAGGRLVGRGISLLLVMAMGAVLAGDLVNRSYGFYPSFSDVLGGAPNSYQSPDSFGLRPEQGRLTVLTPGWQALGVRAARADRGVLLDVVFGGPRSGISRGGLLYVPAAYFVAGSTARLPAVEMFHGVPGRARNYADQLGIAALLDAEIHAGRIPPVFGVIPTIYQGSFSDCVDAVRGQRDETYLTVDVPTDVASTFRVLPGRSYALLGYSTGGFCAANLGLHHPDRYVAAASLSGFFTAGEDPGTIRLYGHNTAAVHRNSPLWWITHRDPTAPPLYLVASTGDLGAVREERTLAQAIRRHAPQLPSYAAILPGGHSFRVWQVAMPAALDWICAYLPVALAPSLQLPRLP